MKNIWDDEIETSVPKCAFHMIENLARNMIKKFLATVVRVSFRRLCRKLLLTRLVFVSVLFVEIRSGSVWSRVESVESSRDSVASGEKFTSAMSNRHWRCVRYSPALSVHTVVVVEIMLSVIIILLVVGPSLSQVRRSGIHYRTDSVTRCSAVIVSDNCWRRTYFCVTTEYTHSAVEMLHDSALYKFMIDIDNNNNTNERQCLCCCHHDSVTARVHPVHLTNADHRQCQNNNVIVM